MTKSELTPFRVVGWDNCFSDTLQNYATDTDTSNPLYVNQRRVH